MAQLYDDWRVVESLSEGGQARTYLVHKDGDDPENVFVLKRIKNLGRLDRFRSEVEAAIRLEHENIVRYVDSNLESEKPYLVTEYCAGGTLGAHSFEDRDTLERLEFFAEICRGVAHAHKNGVIHRDIKPDNIFLKADGTPVVGDFGICFISDEGDRITLTDEAVGARKYTAPELADGRSSDVTPACDVYSLGKLLYWVFAGRVMSRENHRDEEWDLTFNRVGMGSVKASELAFVKELLDRSVRHDPTDRFRHAVQFEAHVRRTVWRMRGRAHVLDLAESQVCNFCGVGEYQNVAESRLGEREYGANEVRRFGLNIVDRSELMVLWCNHCGHSQVFRTDILVPDRGPNWKNRRE